MDFHHFSGLAVACGSPRGNIYSLSCFFVVLGGCGCHGEGKGESQNGRKAHGCFSDLIIVNIMMRVKIVLSDSDSPGTPPSRESSMHAAERNRIMRTNFRLCRYLPQPPPPFCGEFRLGTLTRKLFLSLTQVGPGGSPGGRVGGRAGAAPLLGGAGRKER